LSGFFSKDAILAQAFEQGNHALLILGVLVAALTAFYMTRLVLVVFFGAKRSNAAAQAHESPPVMLWPLRSLAVFSIIGGWIGLEEVFFSFFAARQPGHAESLMEILFAPFAEAPLIAMSGLFAAVMGIVAAWRIYGDADSDPLPAKLGAFGRWMRNRFYFDEFYQATFIRAHDFIATVADWIDRWIVDGFCVGLVRGGTNIAGRALRLMQTGNLQTYALLFALGVAAVLWFVLGK
jgi:NADH-quinone oxidoreductase subunit L